ncbi:MAG: hypothetical protein LH473_03995 [Chitinophagales bacterium]|nr:hypothetical protein [Chitinophagales bacterium]
MLLISIEEFIIAFDTSFKKNNLHDPWEITNQLKTILNELLPNCKKEFIIENGIAIHQSAVIHERAILAAPVIINANCFVGANAILRGGVFLGNESVIGSGCEIKSSIIMNYSSIAHLNFIGDSIIGSNVNFEAGAICANHYNERKGKKISVFYNAEIINTGIEKFGSLVGDHSKIGANAVLSPGTLLKKNTIVKRLELIEQVK